MTRRSVHRGRAAWSTIADDERVQTDRRRVACPSSGTGNLAPVAAAAFDAPAASAAAGGLIWTLVRTDFKARYHGTLSGFVWALLKPLTMFVVLTAVFSLVFASDRTYKLDLIVGLFLWDFFAEGTKTGLTAAAREGVPDHQGALSRRGSSWSRPSSTRSSPSVVFGVVISAFLSLIGATTERSAPFSSSRSMWLRSPSSSSGSRWPVACSSFATVTLNQVWDVVDPGRLLSGANHLPPRCHPRAVSLLSLRVASDGGHRVFTGRARGRPHTYAFWLMCVWRSLTIGVLGSRRGGVSAVRASSGGVHLKWRGTPVTRGRCGVEGVRHPERASGHRA